MIRTVFSFLGRFVGLAFAAMLACALPRTALAIDGFAPNPTSVVNTIAQQSDGKLLIGGFFTSFTPDNASQSVNITYLARINTDGTVDTSFAPNPDGAVDAILVLPDQSILIGGQFTHLTPAGGSGTIACNRIAHILPNGSVDTTFKAGVNGASFTTSSGATSSFLGTPEVYAIFRQLDGKILVGGFFNQETGSNGTTASNWGLMRLNADGSIDSSFNLETNPNGLVMTFVQDIDGSVLVGGGFTTLQAGASGTPITRNRMARILPNGTIDPTFDPNFNNRVNAIAVLTDGTIVVGGGFTSLQPNGASTASARAFLASLGHDGSLNSRFASSYSGAVNALAVQPDGMILIGGAFNGLSASTGSSTIYANYIVRVRPDGTADPTFAASPAYTVSSILVESDGNIVIGGFFSGVKSRANGNAISRWYLARLTSNGSLDTQLDGNTGLRLDKVFPLKGGQYLLCGSIPDISGVTRGNLVRIAADGTLDPSFNPTVSGTPVAFAEQADGSIIVVGSFSKVDGVARNNIARIKSDGTLDTTFDPNCNGNIVTVAIQSDGKILVGGNFNTFQPNNATTATTISNMARLNTDGTLDSTFDAGPAAGVNCIALDSKGRIYVGGNFTSFSGAKNSKNPACSYMARLNSDGSMDSTFVPIFNNSVANIRFESDTSMLVTGGFTGVQNHGTVTTYTRNFIARVSDLGVFDATYDPNLNSSVRDLVVLPDGTSVIGGYFTSLTPNGATTAITDHMRLVRLNKDGTLYTSFKPNPNGNVSSIAIRADGRLFVTGGFMTLASSSDGSWVHSPGIAIVGTDGTVDSTFKLGNLPSIAGDVRAMGVQEDGMYVIGGTFAGLLGSPGANLARIDAEGAADPSFSPNPDNTVDAVAVIPNVVGVPTLGNVVGWLNADGTLKTGLNISSFPTLTGHASVVARQADGKILVGGNFYTTSGTLYYDMIRLNTDGSIDSTFNLTFNSTVSAVVQASDGTLYVAGDFSTVNSTSVNRVAKIKPDGTLDTTFNPAPNAAVLAMIAQPSDGKLIIAGSFTTLQPNGASTTTSRNYLARINTDGTLDTGYNPNPQSTVSALALESGGTLIIGGSFGSVAPNGGAATTRYYLGRIKADGTLDTNFNPDPNGAISALAIQTDGKILVGGAFTTLTPNGATTATTRYHLVRLNTDGTIDTTLPDLALDSQPETIVPQSDGTIYLGGLFTTVASQRRNYLARISSVGVLDAGFNPNPNGDVASLLVLSSGELVIGGGFSTVRPYGALLIGGKFAKVGSSTANHLAFLNQDGDPLSSYNVGADDEVKAILRQQSDGSFLVGGAFKTIDGTTLAALARLTAAGAVDSTFKATVSNGVNTAVVNAIALQPDSKILIGGSFMTVDGVSRSDLARLNADGTIDNTFTVTADDQVNAIAYGPDGSVYVAGAFKSLGGSGVSYLGRIKSDGSVDAMFNPAPDAPVSSVVVSADGTLVVGGSFTRIGGGSSANLARLNADGTLSSMQTAAVNGPVMSLFSTYDGRTFVGGAFTSFDGTGHYVLGRLGIAEAASSRMTLSSDLSTITWVRGGSAPVVPTAAFDYSTDLHTWTRLGVPTYDPVARAWVLSGQNSLTAGTLFFIRAQATQPSGSFGSNSLVNAVQAFYPTAFNSGTSASSVVGTTGHSISFMLGDGSVGTSYSATGLPPGVTINPLTGLVSGTPTAAGSYAVVFSINHGGVVTTISQTWLVVTPGTTVPSGNPGQKLMAISALARIGANYTQTFGFAISGSSPKQVLLRAVGPTLANFSVANPIAKPLLKVFNSSSAVIATNQGWNNDATVSSVSNAVGDFPLNAGSLDAALVLTLQPGLYTMQVSDAAGVGGSVLAEVYDGDTSSAVTRMTSLSSRGLVSGSTQTLTAGFVVGGTLPQRVLVRGVGAGLASYGVPGVLSDAKISLYSISNGVSQLVAVNDNWETQTPISSSQTLPDAGQLSATFTQTGAFPLASGSTDAAMVVTLNPGVYTLVVSGGNGASGDALAEIYLLQ